MSDISLKNINVNSNVYSVRVSKDEAVIEEVSTNTTYSLTKNYHFKKDNAKFEEKSESPNLFGSITPIEMQAIISLRIMYSQEKDPAKKAQLKEAYDNVLKIAGHGKLMDANTDELKIGKGE